MEPNHGKYTTQLPILDINGGMLLLGVNRLLRNRNQIFFEFQLQLIADMDKIDKLNGFQIVRGVVFTLALSVTISVTFVRNVLI